jgi:flagella basal body P-ring formation protein FlgA
LVEAPQLAAIARDYGVAWRPASGSERAVLERAGAQMALKPIMTALRAALVAAGAALDADIDLPGFDPPTVPAGSDAIPAVAQLSFDAATGRFTALLAVSAPEMPPIHARLSGQVTVMVQAVILTRHVRPGIVVTAEDVRTARIRAGLLRGNPAVAADAVIGQALRHDMQAGQALTALDITRPRLVARNDVVRMTLQAGGIALAAQGIALEDGGEGDRIRVQNPSSHAVMIAEITAADEVRVTPDHTPLIVAAQ